MKNVFIEIENLVEGVNSRVCTAELMKWTFYMKKLPRETEGGREGGREEQMNERMTEEEEPCRMQ